MVCSGEINLNPFWNGLKCFNGGLKLRKNVWPKFLVEIHIVTKFYIIFICFFESITNFREKNCFFTFMKNEIMQRYIRLWTAGVTSQYRKYTNIVMYFRDKIIEWLMNDVLITLPMSAEINVRILSHIRK